MKMWPFMGGVGSACPYLGQGRFNCFRTWFRNANQWYPITSWPGGFNPKASGAWGRSPPNIFFLLRFWCIFLPCTSLNRNRPWNVCRNNLPIFLHFFVKQNSKFLGLRIIWNVYKKIVIKFGAKYFACSEFDDSFLHTFRMILWKK